MPRHQGVLLPIALLGGAAAFRIFRSRSLRARTATSLLLAGLTLAMTMPPSVWLWDHVRILQYTQFPWRWLSLGASTLALVVPAFGLALRLHGSDTARRCYGVALGAGLLLTVGLYGGPDASWSRWEFDPDPELPRRSTTLTALGDEYGPVWRAAGAPRAVAAGEAQAQGAAATKAVAPGSAWRWRIGERPSPGQVVAGVNYFPGWRAYWSDPASARQELRVDDASGLVGVKVPAGSAGFLELELGDTPPRRAAKLLSASSLLVGAALLVWLRRRGAATPPAG